MGLFKPGDEPIPGYHLEKWLGAGAFGEVWQATGPGRVQLAMKFVKLAGSSQAGWKEFRAIQRVKGIRHANLIPIFSIWLIDDAGKILTDEDVDDVLGADTEQRAPNSGAETIVVRRPSERRPAMLVIAMALADKSLSDRLEECRNDRLDGVSPFELLGYLHEAAKGLDFLNLETHAVGSSRCSVTHCDVKPANIMLMGGSIVVSDFGVAQARAESQSVATGTSLGGTAAYMGPELFDSKPTRSSDQYALAVTYYELRTGRLPFEKTSFVAILETAKAGTQDFSAVSDAERRVLKKATSSNPEQRYASCVKFVAALDKALNPDPPSSPKSFSARYVAATLALAAVVATAGYITINGGGKDTSPKLDPIQIALQSDDLAMAVTLAKAVPPASLSEVLSDFLSALQASSDSAPDHKGASIPDLEKARLGAELLAHLRTTNSEEGAASPADQQRVEQAVANLLNMRLQKIQAQFQNSSDATVGEVDPELTQELRALSTALQGTAELAARALSDRGRASSFAARNALLEARVNLRSQWQEKAKWKEIRESLQTLGTAEAVSADDQGAYRALIFILDVALAVDSDDRQQVERWLEQLESLERLVDLDQDRPPPELTAWELDQAKHCRETVQRAINNSEWLADEGFSALASRTLKLGEEFRCQVFLNDATRRRREGNYSEAQRLLGLARTAGQSAGLSAELHDQFLAHVENESLAIGLAAPTGEALARLAPQDDDPPYERWQALATDVIDIPGKAPAESVSLFRLLTIESTLMGELRPGDARALLEWAEQTMAATSPLPEELQPYRQYVAALISDQRANRQNAADQITSVFANNAKPLLVSAPFRLSKAVDVLSSAANAYRDGSADSEFGVDDLDFANVQLRRQAFDWLTLARQLARQLSERGKLPNLAAADEALWIVAAGELEAALDKEAYQEIGRLAADLLVKHKMSSGVEEMLGRIALAWTAAQQQPAFPSDFQARERLVKTYAFVLRRLYPQTRPQEAPDRTRVTLNKHQRLAIKRRIVAPALEAAERMSEASKRTPQELSPDGKLALVMIFRAAGFLFTDRDVAVEAALDGVTDLQEQAFKYLHRVNELNDLYGYPSDAEALVQEGRAYLNRPVFPDNWRAELDAIANRAMDATQFAEINEAHAAISARARQLKATALVQSARDVSVENAGKKERLDQAIELLEEASGLWRGSADPTARSELADILTTRSSAHVERQFLRGVEYDKRLQLLQDACQYAAEASEIENRDDPENALIAWGNALEDLAFYLLTDPERNYGNAEEKFLAAFNSLPDFLRERKGLLPLTGLLRCRIRLVQSNVLGNPHKEKEILEEAVRDAEDKGRSLVLVSKEPAGVNRRAMRDVLQKTQVAEFQLFLAIAHREIAERGSAEERTENLRKSTAALEWASRLADGLASGNWAAIQLEWARTEDLAGDPVAARKHAENVLDAKGDGTQSVSNDNLISTLNLLRQIDEKSGKAWDEQEWNAAIKLLSTNDDSAVLARLQVQMQRLDAALDEPAWNQRTKEIEESLQKIRGTASDAAREIEGQLLQRRGDRAYLTAWNSTSKTWDENRLREAVERYTEEIQLRDTALEAVLAARLDLLKKDSSNPWSRASLWQERQLKNHLAQTLNTRVLLVKVISQLIEVSRPPAAERKVLRQQGVEALRLSHPDCLPTGAHPEFKDYEDWPRVHNELTNAFLSNT